MCRPFAGPSVTGGEGVGFRLYLADFSISYWYYVVTRFRLCTTTMSAVSSKPLTLARIEDLTLGSFAFLQPSETLDHLVRFLSTWSGSELSTMFTLKSHLDD